MQTFLSENSFALSAQALDSKRLNKQLLEGRQILVALAGETKGWVNHPATRMWRGYEAALVLYLDAIKNECVKRGIEVEKNWLAILDLCERHFTNDERKLLPPWVVDREVLNKIIVTHQARLYEKDPDYYNQYKSSFETVDKAPLDWVCCATRRQGGPCQYYWPTHLED